MSYGIRIAGRLGVGTGQALLLSTCAFFTAASTAALAQDTGTTVLEGITIYSANKTPTDAAKVGSSVEVITEEDLEKQSKTFLKDYLEQLPGVNFRQNGPPGTASGITIRGAAGKYVKVLIDGIDVSDPANVETATHFEHLLVGDVSRIEVLKGSQSMLYGGDAVAGVISIDTKAPTKPGYFQRGNAEYGRYNTYRGAYTAGYAAPDGSNISFTAQGVDTDGFSAASAGTEDDGYRNVTLSGRGEYFLSPSAKIFFAARTLDAKTEYDGSEPPDYILKDMANYVDTVQHAGRIGTEFSLFNGAFQNTFAVQGMKIQRDYFGGEAGWFDGDRIKGEYKGVITFTDRISLLAGADWEETGAQNAVISRQTADVAGIYAQLMIEPVDGLVLTGGGRIDDHSNFGEFETYRFTGAYLIPGTETKIRGSISTGFRAPSLDELYGSYPDLGIPDYGNPDLQPEESDSWDIGIEQGFFGGRLRLAATYFELNTENLIAFDGDCFVMPVQCLTNFAGVTDRRGVEISGVAQITSNFLVTTSYTHTDTKRPNGLPLAAVPEDTFVIGFDYKPVDKVELNVTGRYVSDAFLSTTADYDDYFLLSAKAAYEFTPGWKAYVRGDNLTDERYETIPGYGTAGLSVYGGITMALPSD